MALAGCLVLAFGWFGFNAGSTLAGGDLRISVVAVNTMLASAGGAMSAMMYMWFRYGKPDISMAANGMLAGLVAITAPCAFVTPIASVVIGVIAGVLLCISVLFVENVLKIDDPVGAISVHGVNGAWGMLALGLFADGSYGDKLNGVEGTVKGLFYGDPSQFAAQCVAVAVNIIFVFTVMYVFFKISDKIAKMRVPAEVEQEGLDMAEVAVIGYPEFSINKTHR
jgi:Amt family ammonium transporter